MKPLTPDEIECLLGVRSSDLHPLDLLGYGYTSEGAQRFQVEQPDLLPQIAAYIRSVLMRKGIFPEATDAANPGVSTFIQVEGALCRVSTMEEVGVSRFERIFTNAMPETDAIHEYIRRVANPDYIKPL